MSAVSSRLSALQRELLQRFFADRSEFFLTGGAALAGFYLGHRTTEDLDLFAPPTQSMEEGVRILRRVADAAGATIEGLQESPDFRRFAIVREGETTVVDLAIDRAPQLETVKTRVEDVPLDSLREIAANKICALLGRTAPRDLFDLAALRHRGATLESMLTDAHEKDRAVDPANLAWVLSRYVIPPTAPLPEGTTRENLERTRDELIEELVVLAAPSEPDAGGP